MSTSHYLVNIERISQAKETAVHDSFSIYGVALVALRAAAESRLSTPLQSVMSKELMPPSGDRHDYASLAKYWWPNPDSVDGLPYIRNDGVVNPEVEKYDVKPLDLMVKAVRDLSFAYFFTGDERYSKHAASLLKAWFIDPETRMNPNANFAQFRPGISDVTGSGTIETHRFRWIPDNAELLRASPDWTAENHSALRVWFGQYANWLIESEPGKKIRQNPDNKGTWCTQQIALYALFAGNVGVAKKYVESAKDRIAAAIAADGSQPTEMGRTRTFHYHKYHLQAFFDLAVLGDLVDVDLYNFTTPDGRGLRKALEYLIPYGIDERPWPYEQIDAVRYGIMKEILRRASVGYREKRYEDLLAKVPSSSAGDATLVEYLDLIVPPLN